MNRLGLAILDRFELGKLPSNLEVVEFGQHWEDAHDSGHDWCPLAQSHCFEPALFDPQHWHCYALQHDAP